MNPEVRDAGFSDAVEMKPVGDQDDAIRTERVVEAGVPNAPAREAIIIQAPEGAEHAGVMPADSVGVAALMNPECGETGASQTIERRSVAREGGTVAGARLGFHAGACLDEGENDETRMTNDDASVREVVLTSRDPIVCGGSVKRG